MSLNKENEKNYCLECYNKSCRKDHVCSSQLLSDSIYTLSEISNEQLNEIEQFSLSEYHLKCQQELELWHSKAVNHLQQIFQHNLNDLNHIFQDQVQPELEKYKEKIIQQIQNRILPKIEKIIDDQTKDKAKIEKLQNLINHIKSDGDVINEQKWINIQLPDIKNFSVPIRIAKMALAARLTDGEKDPLEDLSDEDVRKDELKEKNQKKKINSIDVVEVFANYPEPTQIFPLDTNSSTLAFSTKHILIHDNKKLILFDLNRKIQEFTWNDNDFGIIVDMCWMSSLSVFLILTIHSVYLYDPMRLNPNIPVKIESIKPSDRSHVLASISSFDRDLFINYHKGVHIDQYRSISLTEWTLQKRFSKNECCEAKDIGIRDIRCDNEHICLSIMQHDDLKWRLDLMSRDMIRIRRGVAMDSGENQHKFFSMLIPLYDQRWLFINWFTNKLWIVDQQGKTRLVKETKIKNIRNIAISQDSTFLAIRNEKPSILQIHKL